ncbi:MAG: redoxin domain-containing protein [Anaerolineae bacterium]|nr:redoxin domain-containing protein [Anaerolineae bacterium]
MSVDSVYTHKAWEEHELSELIESGMPWPMLSDMGGNVGRAYGMFDADTGKEVRGYFLIDPDGLVQASSAIMSDIGHDVLEIIRQIEAIQHSFKTGEATPEGWQPGMATLQPGVDLVGKVHTVWKREKKNAE